MISIIVIVAVITAFFMIGILTICGGVNDNNPLAFCIGLVLIVVVIALAVHLYVKRPSIEDPDRESFHKIVKMDIGDDVYKQIAILPNEEVINVSTAGIKEIGVAKIYPDNAILRRYGYKSESKWIDYNNENSFFYEIIVPSNERYEEIKEKVVEMKIIDVDMIEE